MENVKSSSSPEKTQKTPPQNIQKNKRKAEADKVDEIVNKTKKIKVQEMVKEEVKEEMVKF